MKIEHLLGERRSRRARAGTVQPSTVSRGAGAFDAMTNTLAGAAKGNTMANAPVSVSNKARPDNANLKVIPGGKPTAEPAVDPAITANPVPTVDPNAATGPTGDPTLDQPLAPAASGPKKSLTQMGARALGGLSKAVGGIASIPQGVGRAMKKGYQAGVQNIGGPGAAMANAAGYQSVPSMPAAGVGRSTQADQAGQSEIDDLKRTLSNLDRRLRVAGLEETGQSKKR